MKTGMVFELREHEKLGMVMRYQKSCCWLEAGLSIIFIEI
jgi:hypothetical protein